MDPLPICLAASGGLAIKLLDLMELSSIARDRRPNLKDLVYWLPFFIGPVLAALVAFAYVKSNFELRPVLALHVGVSAPLILRGMAVAIPRAPTPQAGA